MTNMSNVISCYRAERRVLTLALNRPARGNSLSPPLLVELRRLVLEAQGTPRCGRSFSRALARRTLHGIDVDTARDFRLELKPTSLMSPGRCHADLPRQACRRRNQRAGDGMGVVFASAAITGSPRITLYSNAEVTWGLPGASCIAIMTRTCGVAWTRRILMGGAPFSCQDALTAHIIDQILPKDQFLAAATERRRTSAKKSPPTGIYQACRD